MHPSFQRPQFFASVVPEQAAQHEAIFRESPLEVLNLRNGIGISLLLTNLASKKGILESHEEDFFFILTTWLPTVHFLSVMN